MGMFINSDYDIKVKIYSANCTVKKIRFLCEYMRINEYILFHLLSHRFLKTAVVPWVFLKINLKSPSFLHHLPPLVRPHSLSPLVSN